MHRLNLFRLPAIFLALFILVGLFALVLAAPQNPAPGIAKTPGKIAVGSRPQGKIAFISDGAIWLMDSDGRNRRKICEVTNARGRLSFSRDNKRIAFGREGKDASKLPSDEGGAHLLHDVFIAYIDSAASHPGWWRKATFTLGGDQPQWINDTLMYIQNDVFAGNVDYIIPSFQISKVNPEDGHVVTLRKDVQMLHTSMKMPAVSPDGKKIAFVLYYDPNPGKNALNNQGLKVMNMADIMIPEAELRRPTKGLEQAVAPSWSPDGQWLAYLSNDMNNQGIYIIKSDLTDKRLVFAPTATQNLNTIPIGWSPDSKWMTFATDDGTIYIIDINGEQLTAITGSGAHGSPTWSH